MTVIKELDSQSRVQCWALDQVQISLSSFRGRSSECQELLRTWWLKVHCLVVSLQDWGSWIQCIKRVKKFFCFFFVIVAVFCFCFCFVLFLFFFCARKNSFLVRFSKNVSIVFFSPISVLVEVCSTNLVDIRSSRFLLAKRWFSSDWKRSLIAFL